MIGIILATHGNLAHELLETAQSIIGPQEHVKLLSIDFQHDVDTIFTQYEDCLKDVNQGEGVLILTDMFGGTPSNISLSYLNTANIEVLTGVNLPMLIKVLTSRAEAPTPTALAKMAKTDAIDGIVIASEVMRQKVEEI
ncbi:PTS sugar transporter subunit IIA [Desulfurispirillum indicum]|uniref:PTS system fructose subfamily IIA component n=1 Tax=Desulfurispirillum indicum (strain ATCC BAA-1389 / DSM 22839 / S5) TaxID=653733 RepID=E6W1Z4_DESIS|nr:PTS sugar transporter subunit IIA [Desulfurispirillum indicum]ADU66620.1 PTS system fructose subfamily IIA component [Desulfurispirillum indicum S5]UCZ55938.1 PTS sugar transporter subunit IIA [Desulfurispirillum indicum]